MLVCILEPSELIKGLHLYLLRRIKKNVPSDRWEKVLAKFYHPYNQWVAWDLEQHGYTKLKLEVKLSIIRVSTVIRYLLLHTSVNVIRA